MTSLYEEKKVVRFWMDVVAREDVMVTENGEPVRILYPGRPVDDRGPDFCDAVILTGSGIRRGSIEVHVKSGDWKRHGHHRDPVYNNVILHVFLEEDSYLHARQAGGDIIPAVCLKNLDRMTSPDRFTLPCAHVACIFSKKVESFLLEMGKVRFLEKVSYFQREIEVGSADEVLYQGIASALGYRKNREALQTLAQMVTFKELQEIVSRSADDAWCRNRLVSLLLGTAGLLPSQRGIRLEKGEDREYVVFLEYLWKQVDCRSTMSSEFWRRIKVRPLNHPVRRIVALAFLVGRYGREGLVSLLLRSINKTGKIVIEDLVRYLLVDSLGYWLYHYDFGKRSPVGIPSLVGRDRAGIILINVILPFLAALNSYNIQKEVEAVFSSFTGVGSNAIEKHMIHQLGMSGRSVKKACIQQGLLHVYKTMCIQGKCNECLLNPAVGYLNQEGISSILSPATTSRSSPANLPA